MAVNNNNNNNNNNRQEIFVHAIMQMHEYSDTIFERADFSFILTTETMIFVFLKEYLS